MIKLFWIFTLCLAAIFLQAQKDTVYRIRVISLEDSLPLEKVIVRLQENGIALGREDTDAGGMVKFRNPRISKNCYLQIEAIGFSRVTLTMDSLLPNTTTVVKLKYDFIHLDNVSIVSYIVPMIESERKYYKSAKTGKVYTEEQLEAYKVLAKGKWYVRDAKRKEGQMLIDTIQRYLAGKIQYPHLAKDLGEYERIYLSFELDKQGYSQNITLIKGKSPILALEAAMALAEMPKVKYSFDLTYPPARPLRFLIPFDFILK